MQYTRELISYLNIQHTVQYRDVCWMQWTEYNLQYPGDIKPGSVFDPGIKNNIHIKVCRKLCYEF